jgi:hypothetical protein
MSISVRIKAPRETPTWWPLTQTSAEGGAVPVAGAVEALRDGAHVFAEERLGVDVIVDQCGEHGAGNGGAMPAEGMICGRRDDGG